VEYTSSKLGVQIRVMTPSDSETSRGRFVPYCKSAAWFSTKNEYDKILHLGWGPSMEIGSTMSGSRLILLGASWRAVYGDGRINIPDDSSAELLLLVEWRYNDILPCLTFFDRQE